VPLLGRWHNIAKKRDETSDSLWQRVVGEVANARNWKNAEPNEQRHVVSDFVTPSAVSL
jgi:hypothetical protein